MASIIPSYYDFKDMLSLPLDAARAKASSFGIGGGAEKTAAPAETVQSETAPPTSSPVTAPPTAPAQAPAPVEATTPNVINLGSVLSGFDLPSGGYADYFAPISKEMGNLRESLASGTQAFSNAAGPARSFEALGGTGALDKAVNTGEGMDAARAMAGASYTGPGGLEAVGLPGKAASLGNWVGALHTTPGAMDLVQQKVPGLTPGEARFEARHLLQDPEYLRSLEQFSAAQRQLSGAVGSAQQQATDYAAQRRAEEEGIREQTRGYLTGREGDISADLEAQLSKAKADEAAAQELWDKFQGGDWAAALEFEKLSNPELSKAWTEWDTARDAIMSDPRYATIRDLPLMLKSDEPGAAYKWDDEWWGANEKRFGKGQWKAYKELAHARQRALDELGAEPQSMGAIAEEYQRRQEARGKFDQVWNQFSKIQDIPLLETGISGKGRAKYTIVDPDTGRSTNVKDYLKSKGYKGGELKIKLQAVEDRQRILEQYFGDVVDPRAAKWRWKEQKTGESQDPRKHVGARYEGEYRDLAPLAYGGDLAELPDPRSYLQLQLSVQPSIHNVSTEEQRAQFNRVNDLLGEAERLVKSDPWKASQIVDGVGQYIDAEQRALESRGERLDERRAEWLRSVKKARSRYTSTSATISRVIDDTVGHWATSAMGPASLALGDPTGGLLQGYQLANLGSKPGKYFEPMSAQVTAAKNL